MNDLFPAIRALAETPRFTLLAVLVVAVGIAGNTVVFSLVNGLFLRPVPFPEPDRPVDLDATAPKLGRIYTGINYDDFEAWRAHNKTLGSMATCPTSWESAPFSGACSPRTRNSRARLRSRG